MNTDPVTSLNTNEPGVLSLATTTSKHIPASYSIPVISEIQNSVT